MNSSLTRVLLALGLLGLVALPFLAQPPATTETSSSLDCTVTVMSDVRFCEVREKRYDAGSHFTVEGVHNGTLEVHGWDRNEVLVRARVETDAGTDADSAKLAGEVETMMDPSRLRIRGPNNTRNFWPFGDQTRWMVSVELYVPHQYDVDVSTHNGALTIADLEGDLRFHTHNGRIELERVAGNLRGSTHNGSLDVDGIEGAGRTDLDVSTHNGEIKVRGIQGRLEVSTHNGAVDLRQVAGDIEGSSHNGQIKVSLAGNSFASQSLDLHTHNGGIRVAMPDNFAAHVAMQTNHGHMDSEFPTVPGRFNDSKMEFDVGGGGPTIRLQSHNGGIDLERL